MKVQGYDLEFQDNPPGGAAWVGTRKAFRWRCSAGGVLKLPAKSHKKGFRAAPDAVQTAAYESCIVPSAGGLKGRSKSRRRR